jgi:ribosomal protein S18 acetylase RimI-like enzyme
MAKFLLTIDAQSISGQIAKLLNSGGQLWAYMYPMGILNNRVQYIIELDGDIVTGVVGLEQQRPNVSEIKHLCVHPDYRCRGLGRKLLEIGLKAAQTEFVYGAVRSDNHTNIRNNLRIGMVPVGKKRGRGCHVIIFARRTNSESRFQSR